MALNDINDVANQLRFHNLAKQKKGLPRTTHIFTRIIPRHAPALGIRIRMNFILHVSSHKQGIHCRLM